MMLNLTHNDEFNDVGGETAGPSGSVPRNSENFREITSTLLSTESPFDQGPSQILKGILQEAAATKDYTQARKEAFNLIKEHGLQ